MYKLKCSIYRHMSQKNFTISWLSGDQNKEASVRIRENAFNIEVIAFFSKAFLSYKYMLLEVQKFRAFLEENMFNKKSSGRLDFISTRSFF